MLKGVIAKSAVDYMNAEGLTKPVRWTRDQLKSRFPSMVDEVGYDDIAKMFDQQATAQSVSQVEKDIFANVIVKIVMSHRKALPHTEDKIENTVLTPVNRVR